MNTRQAQADCQIKDVHCMANGQQDPISFGKSLRLFLRKMMGPRNVRLIKGYANDFLNWVAKIKGKPTRPPEPLVEGTVLDLKAGDLVRVRSEDEIKATLDHWGRLKGCTFAPEMMLYCNTTQRVLKPVERFVDERDLRIRRAKAIVLLEGIVCQGTATLGRCDRSCFFFWREEWLEKIA